MSRDALMQPSQRPTERRGATRCCAGGLRRGGKRGRGPGLAKRHRERMRARDVVAVGMGVRAGVGQDAKERAAAGARRGEAATRLAADEE